MFSRHQRMPYLPPAVLSPAPLRSTKKALIFLALVVFGVSLFAAYHYDTSLSDWASLGKNIALAALAVFFTFALLLTMLIKHSSFNKIARQRQLDRRNWPI